MYFYSLLEWGPPLFKVKKGWKIIPVLVFSFICILQETHWIRCYNLLFYIYCMRSLFSKFITTSILQPTNELEIIIFSLVAKLSGYWDILTFFPRGRVKILWHVAIYLYNNLPMGCNIIRGEILLKTSFLTGWTSQSQFW